MDLFIFIFKTSSLINIPFVPGSPKLGYYQLIMHTHCYVLLWKVKCHLFQSYLSGAHFTNDFTITIQIRWKFHLALIQLLMTISQQNLAHATTTQLSRHVPNIVAITLLVFGWEQKWNFHHIWIVMEKLLAKWAPGLLHWFWGILMTAPVISKQSWKI